MLAISVDASSQVPYRSFPCRHGKSLTPLLLLLPKSLATFREPYFLCSGILNACLTLRKENLMSLHLRSGFGFSWLLDKWKKPLHDITNGRGDFSCSDSQCYVTALGFKTLLPYASRKGQHKFGGGQPCPLADIPFFHLCAYLIFNLPIPLRVFQNTIAAISVSRFWANFLEFPMDGNFIHLFWKLGKGILSLTQ